VTPAEQAQEAAETLARLTGVECHDVALVLGSGWLPAAASLGEPSAQIATTDLAGFSAPAVEGHAGTIGSLQLEGRRLLLFGTRTHYYEGKGVAAVVHPVRTAAAASTRRGHPAPRC
jgi:purine-nucleoside phosphorylase